ncbi:ketoacyl reductase hetN, putative [Perkinsus marinus ATCC 50983]|uniref:Ketoacyl reductase hetN, putative n=3 Tax=Perkinsus marinus (strain ATCC 50983 / TXsc) TaxID=423536 RepID=C5KZ49_PERM5|nr:ketoacyl reductase hetN, putative [Perkinsus marinus ATCC 50983]EER10245.1 ketoacyl reductase hetN, putative [Perkinsus marinus ATCC 50983]|eukprot:XP_002778450.1 ketoacyl reductase hetN, putative [Perkinsus marinus ATCC 50983]
MAEKQSLPVVLSMGAYPFTFLEWLSIIAIMLLCAPIILTGMALCWVVQKLQGPIFNMGYPYNLKPVRASREEYAVVTGASKGMGRQFAMKLAKAGWSLVIAARNEKLLNELKDTLVKTYGPSCKVAVVPCDLSCDEGLAKLRAAVDDLPVTLAVLNAGGMYSCDIVNLEPEKLEAQIRLNIIQQVMLSQYFMAHHFVPRGKGRVCIMSSLAAHFIGSGNAFYYSSKSFLTQWGKCLDHECRTLGAGVLTIQPGAMNDTNFSNAAGCKASPCFTLLNMPSEECTDEVVWRLQNDDPRIATGVHTIGFMNQVAVALEPWLSDSFDAWLGRMMVFQPNTPYLRSMNARESKLAILTE